MPPTSLQLQSVIDAFGQQGWHCDQVEGREVVRTAFEAHHTNLDLIAQAFPQLNALAVVAEAPMAFDSPRQPLALELINRANKQLTLGSFEFDLDRELLVFRITKIFDREKFDRDIISCMVHCAIAEVDRFTPLAAVLNQTAEDLLPDLSIPLLLEREDHLPPVPEFGEEEER